jgi:hypothetical protein
VYHTYKDSDRRMCYWYTTDESEDDIEMSTGEYIFDVRDLKVDLKPEGEETAEEWHRRKILRAIDEGMLKLPEHNQSQ